MRSFLTSDSTRLVKMTATLALHFIIALSPSANGHGLLHEQIAEVSGQLKKDPGNQALLLRRAELHRAHDQPKEARNDFHALTQANPPYLKAFPLLASFEREQGNFKEALKAITTYFRLGGNQAGAHREKALICYALEQYQEASESWKQYLEATASPSAQDYSNAASTCLFSKQTDQGHHWVQKGLQTHPRAIPLHQMKARLMLAERKLEAAHESFSTLRTFYPALSHRLFFEEGNLLKQAGFPTEAKTAYQSALTAFEKLPPRKQAIPALVSLRKQLVHELEK